MKIVYLDQCKWIELARAANGDAPELVEVLDFVRETRDMKLACFPLSFTHYMETHKASGVARRLRLATVMADISGGRTIAPPTSILRSEIDEALQGLFPNRVRAGSLTPLELLGEGMAHATGDAYFAPNFGEDFDKLPLSVQIQMKEWYELSMLSGVYPDGDSSDRADVSDQELGFKTYLDSLKVQFDSLPDEKKSDYFYVAALIDVFKPLSDALARHAISLEEFTQQDLNSLRRFVDELPSQRVMMHLSRQWAKNSSLRAKRNELYDWGQMAPMLPYCDVLVTEKQFADLVTRDSFQERAIVTPNVEDLPHILVDLTRLD